MKSWNDRSREVANLLNPAFCGRIIYNVVKVYYEEAKRPMQFPLIYIILPIVLHKKTRSRLSSKTQMHVWIKRNPDLLVGFAERTRSLVDITNETLEFLLQAKLIEMNEDADLSISRITKSLSKTKYTNDEVMECIRKSTGLAKWFAKSGTVESIYTNWGIKP